MSIKVLIIDDDPNKIGIIKNTILETELVGEEDITHSLDVKEGMKKLSNNRYDLVILDIQLPARIGEEQITTGGNTILNYLIGMDRVKKPLCVIGITAYDESIDVCEKGFNDNLFCLIKYQRESVEWREQIQQKAKWLVTAKKQLVEEIEKTREYEYDFAIITAVPIEMSAVKDLEFEWQELRMPNDEDIYYVAEKKFGENKIKVVMTRAKRMGMSAASTVTTKVIAHFKPRYVVMTGITGGRKGEVEIGDLILAETAFDYGCGKWKIIEETGEEIFEADQKQISIASRLSALFSKDYSEVMNRIKNKWNAVQGQTIRTDSCLRVGPLATGAAVVQNETIINQYIVPHNRKVLGVDMETYGFYYACENALLPKPEFFSIKAVSDYADNQKNDNYQAYCAFTSANFLYELMQELI